MRTPFRGAPSGAWPLAGLFAINGLLFSSWFPWIATVKTNLGLTDGELGNALWGLPAGLLLGIWLTVPLMRRLGVKRTAIVGVLLYCTALPLPALAWDEWSLGGLLAVGGLGNGIMEPPAYRMADWLKQRWNGREIVGTMTGIFSLFQITAPMLTALAIALAVPVWSHLAVVAVLGLALAGYACPRLPDAPAEEKEDASWRRPPPWWARVALLAVLCMTGFVTEGIWAEWHSVLLTGYGIDASPAMAALGYTLYQTATCVTRFAQPGLANRFGLFAVVVASALLVLPGALVIVSAESLPVAFVGVTLLALGAGPIVACAFSAAGSDPKAIVIVSTAGYLGLTAGPPAMGQLSDAVGLQTAFLTPVGLALLMLIVSPVVRRRRAASS